MKQLWHVLLLALHTHRVRPRDALLTVAGFTLAAATLAFLLAIPAGLRQLGASTGRDDIALVLSASAMDEASSAISPQQLDVLATLPHIARHPDGGPMLAPQFIATTKLERTDGVNNTVQLRGVDARTWALLDAVGISGQRPQDGSRELLPGQQARAQYPAFAGNTVQIRKADWAVTGTLEAAGSLWDSEVWADLSALQAAFQAPSQWSVVLLQLDDSNNFDALQAALRNDPRLNRLRVERQSVYYQRSTGWLANLLERAVIGISVLLGLGAALAVGNALSTALERRRREAGTLRAIGFNPNAVASATLLEVLMMGALVALVTFAALHFALHGQAFSTTSGGHIIYAQLQFGLAQAGWVLLYTVLLGALAALWPIKRMALDKLMDALRAD